MTNLPYNEKDISSIFNYSKQLVNKCLRDFAPNAEEHKGKGSLGQLVEELFFKYDLNSRQEADFAFVNAELKCTPLKKSAKEELFRELDKDYISGLTLSGGDPLHEANLDGVLDLVNEIRLSFPNKSIWLYSGYQWEECQPFNEDGLLKPDKFAPNLQKILQKRYEVISRCNVMVDGRYIDSQRNPSKKWAGSDNQRVINIQGSLKQGKVVLYCD